MAHHKVTAPFFVMEYMDNLAEIRTEKGLSRRNVADKTGVPVDYIAQYERGYCFPKKDNYNKLAKFFEWEEWK